MWCEKIKGFVFRPYRPALAVACGANAVYTALYVMKGVSNVPTQSLKIKIEKILEY